MADHVSSATSEKPASALEVFLVFLKLGLTSFGGPVAHLGYFNDEFVARRKWLTAAAYAEIVALCQFLPGPASSQTGMMIGLSRARLPGALAAWLGFTLPSALLLAGFAYGAATLGDLTNAPWLHGLKIAAVAVVAQAIIGMSRSLCPDVPRILFAVLAAAIAIFMPTALGQIGVLILGGLLGLLILKSAPGAALPDLPAALSKPASIAALMLFVALLVALPLAGASDGLLLRLFDSFYRSGALVFGGGHVVLPLLQREVIPPGLIDPEMFLAGYGAAQAVPGPLFTFAAFLGTAIAGGWGALVCTLAIFLPSFLLVIGVLPFWNSLRRRSGARAALQGINAVVVGLLAAAFATLIVPTGITSGIDAGIAAVLLVLLVVVRAPSWLIVALGAAASAAAALV
ncbi:MAG: chromate efflux transporter [Rhodospirillaceae bacterium]|nr:chromate efflux transporter [Rhodospirillaceae bacterium]